MVEHPEWMEDPKLFLDRTALTPIIDELDRPTTRSKRSSTWRRPSGSPTHRSPTARTSRRSSTSGSARTFVENPRDGATNPRPPYRLGSGSPASPEPAPGSASTPSTRSAPAGGRSVRRASWPERPGAPALPFAGLRVLDMTAFWAGPLTGHLLALLGAEVIHLESASRPDGARLVGGVPQTEERFWERGPIFAALNTNKKSMTIDFSDPRGVELLHRVVATCDVVIENYTPRVLDQLGRRLRDAQGRPARSRHAADARLRARWSVARPVGLRLRDRGCIGAHLADGTPRSPPVRAVHHRRPQRRAPRAVRAAWSRSSTERRRAKAAW